MWQTLRASQRSSPGFASSASELLQSTSRMLILATAGAYALWHILATATWPEQLGARAWLITPIVALTCVLPLRLLSQHMLAAQAAWQAGMAVAIAVAAHLFRQPEVAFFLALLPFMAVVTVGWQGGLCAGGMVIALLSLLSLGPWALPMPAAYGLGIVAGGALGGILGWASVRSLLVVTDWSLYSLEEARQRRAELARVARDLDLAYHRLERANAALLAATRAAEEVERLKAEFVTNVSHELRTPLNLIVGFSEMMMTSPESYDDVVLPGPYRSDLNAVHQNAQHLLALVGDVLDVARIQAGKIVLARDEVDLAALVAEAADMVRDYVVAKGLELRVQVAAGLPTLWIDRLRIRQVILNLLINAARFTERGWISVDVARQEEEVVVRVTDTGQGIPEQDLPRIFEEFRTTAQPLSTWHSGTGLGLPISKRFVELHRGRMGVESTYRQGTSFWFTLPCSQVPTAPAELTPHPGRPVARLGSSERIIVVAHEDPRVPRLLQRYLEGFRVAGAADMAAAVALADELKAVALLADSR